MRALRFVFLLCLSAFGFACSSSDTPAATTTDSGATGDTAKDTGNRADTTPTDTGPKRCWVANPSDSTTQVCYACSQDKCKDKWVAAYGANFKTDDFTGGACADDAKCNCACSETDNICQAACDTAQSAACRAAKDAISACHTSQCVPACSFDSPDSGPDGSSDAPPG